MKSTFTLVMEVEQDDEGKMSTVPTLYVEGDSIMRDAIVSFLHQTADEIEQGKLKFSPRN